MAKNWDYAQMAKKASEAGGPDAWINSIKKAAYSSGVSDTKNKLVLPLLLAGAGMGTIGVRGYQKIKSWVGNKKAEKQLTKQEAVEAEKFLKKELNDVLENFENVNIIEFDDAQ